MKSSVFSNNYVILLKTYIKDEAPFFQMMFKIILEDTSLSPEMCVALTEIILLLNINDD